MGKKPDLKEKNNFLKDPLPLLLSLVLAALPLIMFPFGQDVYALPKATFLYASSMLLMFVYFIRAVKMERFVIYRSVLDIPVALILVYAIASLFFSDSPLLGLVGKYGRYEGLPSLICYAVIYFVSVQTIRDEKNFEQMVKVMALGFIPVALYGLVQWTGYDFPGVYRFESRVHSSMGNPILLGAYAVIMLPLLFSLARNSRDESWRLLAWTLILAGVVNLLLTESRGAWLGLTISVLVMLLLRRRPKAIRKKDKGKPGSVRAKNRPMIATIAVLVIVATLMLFNPSSHFGQRLTSTFAFSEGSAAMRLETWKSSLDVVSDNPIKGVGFEQFGYWFPAYATPKYVEIAPSGAADRTHNDFLQVAVDLGVPGLLFYVWMLVIVFLAIFKRWTSFSYATGLSAAIAGYFTQAQTGISAVFVTPVVWSLLGISANMANPGKEFVIKIPQWIKARATVSAAGIVFAGLTLFSFKPIVADIHVYKGQQMIGASLAQAAPEFESAIRLYPYQDAYIKAAAEFYLNYASASGNHIFAQRAALISEQGLRHNKRDFELTYYAAEANLLAYRLTENEALLTKAQGHFETTENLWPSLHAVKDRLLEIALIKGDGERAAAKAEEILKLGGVSPRAYYVLAVEAQKKGEHEKEKLYLRKLQELDPEFLPRTLKD